MNKLKGKPRVFLNNGFILTPLFFNKSKFTYNLHVLLFPSSKLSKSLLSWKWKISSLSLSASPQAMLWTTTLLDHNYNCVCGQPCGASSFLSFFLFSFFFIFFLYPLWIYIILAYIRKYLLGLWPKEKPCDIRKIHQMLKQNRDLDDVISLSTPFYRENDCLCLLICILLSGFAWLLWIWNFPGDLYLYLLLTDFA